MPTEKWVGFKIGAIVALLAALCYLETRPAKPKKNGISKTRIALLQAADKNRERLDRTSKYSHCRQLIRKIEKEKKFDDADREFCLVLAKSDKDMDSPEGLIVLVDAYRHGLTPREEPVSIAQGKALKEAGPRAALGMRMFEQFLNVPGDIRLAMDMNNFSFSPHDKLSEFEKQFIEKGLGDSNAQNHLQGGDLMAIKIHLPAVDKAWCLKHISPQLSKARGDEKLYWTFVDKAVRTKSK